MPSTRRLCIISKFILSSCTLHCKIKICHLILSKRHHMAAPTQTYLINLLTPTRPGQIRTLEAMELAPEVDRSYTLCLIYLHPLIIRWQICLEGGANAFYSIAFYPTTNLKTVSLRRFKILPYSICKSMAISNLLPSHFAFPLSYASPCPTHHLCGKCLLQGCNSLDVLMEAVARQGKNMVWTSILQLSQGKT